MTNPNLLLLPCRFCSSLLISTLPPPFFPSVPLLFLPLRSISLSPFLHYFYPSISRPFYLCSSPFSTPPLHLFPLSSRLSLCLPTIPLSLSIFCPPSPFLDPLSLTYTCAPNKKNIIHQLTWMSPMQQNCRRLLSRNSPSKCPSSLRSANKANQNSTH